MEYRFVTVWSIEAPLETVCETISLSLTWPQWWRSLENVAEVAAGDTAGLGRVLRYTWRGRLPYRLTFDVRIVEIQPLVAVAGVAHGDVEGTGRWSFSTQGSVTHVRYEWQVRTTPVWMNVLALFARPFIRWNHNFVMRQGGEALAHRLNARLIGIRHY